MKPHSSLLLMGNWFMNDLPTCRRHFGGQIYKIIALFYEPLYAPESEYEGGYLYQMTKKKSTLMPRVSTDNRRAIKQVLEDLLAKKSVSSTERFFDIDSFAIHPDGRNRGKYKSGQ